MRNAKCEVTDKKNLERDSKIMSLSVIGHLNAVFQRKLKFAIRSPVERAGPSDRPALRELNITITSWRVYGLRFDLVSMNLAPLFSNYLVSTYVSFGIASSD